MLVIWWVVRGEEPKYSRTLQWLGWERINMVGWGWSGWLGYVNGAWCLDAGCLILVRWWGVLQFRSFDCAPPFAIFLRQGYEGTSYGGQAVQALFAQDFRFAPVLDFVWWRLNSSKDFPWRKSCWFGINENGEACVRTVGHLWFLGSSAGKFLLVFR